jgi:hypothetical protein
MTHQFVPQVKILLGQVPFDGWLNKPEKGVTAQAPPRLLLREPAAEPTLVQLKDAELAPVIAEEPPVTTGLG